MALVIATGRPARWLSQQIASPTDSFRAKIIIQLLCNVLLMSALLTVIGNWIGNWPISWQPFEQFIHLWPRNFAIAFAVEVLIAHPIAHRVMEIYHTKKDQRVATKG